MDLWKCKSDTFLSSFILLMHVLWEMMNNFMQVGCSNASGNISSIFVFKERSDWSSFCEAGSRFQMFKLEVWWFTEVSTCLTFPFFMFSESRTSNIWLILAHLLSYSIPLTVEWSSSGNPDFLLVGCHDGTVNIIFSSPVSLCSYFLFLSYV